MPAVSLLPEGSTLSGVMIPRYDKQRRLESVLRAKQMIILDAQTIEGEAVSIELYGPDGRRTGKIDLGKATYQQEPGILRADQGVSIATDDITARGSGAVVHLGATVGFLLGPVESRLHTPKRPAKTSMTTPSTKPLRPVPTIRKLRRRFAPVALLAAAPMPLLALPAGLSPEQLASIDKAAAPLDTEIAHREADTRALVASVESRSATATANLVSFLKAAELQPVLAQVEQTANTAPAPPKAAGKPLPPLPKPKEIKPTSQDTVVTCDGGMFFDGEIGVLVYLKNIRLANPQFDLSCSNQLKIFLEKQPEKPKAKRKSKPAGNPQPPPESAAPDAKNTAKKPTAKQPGNPALPGLPSDDLFGGNRFGDVRQIVATGDVVIVQKKAGGQPVIAMADTAIFDGKTGDVILRGGLPKLQQGRSAIQAREPGLYIRIYKNGNVATKPGKWKTIAADLHKKAAKKP